MVQHISLAGAVLGDHRRNNRVAVLQDGIIAAHLQFDDVFQYHIFSLKLSDLLLERLEEKLFPEASTAREYPVPFPSPVDLSLSLRAWFRFHGFLLFGGVAA
eukprot:CAMPEP_0185784632 /NCGR_PEP_ID=MMETSP1174-20130828/124451_1 /TAXON_ID=35687 /ORGANISM="Dictyocha speculum, Strain CCMP1381" /LENGTH=101 /DNA_ID=CAMNT_0028476331 /DNA_START=1379 /DNA_END=1684 /DNA_ORIENTATION=+